MTTRRPSTGCSGQCMHAGLSPGRWGDEAARSPTGASPIAPFYGMLVWLNPDGKTFPGASARSVFMVGAGGNYVWIEPAHQAVIVVRWIDSAHVGEFAQRMTMALQRLGDDA